MDEGGATGGATDEGGAAGGATGDATDEGGATGGATAIANDCPEDSDPVSNMPRGTMGPWRKLKSYINKTWIQQRLHVLSVFGQEARTNNAVER